MPRRMTWLLWCVIAFAMWVAVACGGGGGGETATTGGTTGLVWDQGNWDEANWQ